jgi:hypothetical protein
MSHDKSTLVPNTPQASRRALLMGFAAAAADGPGARKCYGRASYESRGGRSDLHGDQARAGGVRRGLLVVRSTSDSCRAMNSARPGSHGPMH